jgi:hypothetical protein
MKEFLLFSFSFPGNYIFGCLSSPTFFSTVLVLFKVHTVNRHLGLTKCDKSNEHCMEGDKNTFSNLLLLSGFLLCYSSFYFLSLQVCLFPPCSTCTLPEMREVRCSLSLSPHETMHLVLRVYPGRVNWTTEKTIQLHRYLCFCLCLQHAPHGVIHGGGEGPKSTLTGRIQVYTLIWAMWGEGATPVITNHNGLK